MNKIAIAELTLMGKDFEPSERVDDTTVGEVYRYAHYKPNNEYDKRALILGADSIEDFVNESSYYIYPPHKVNIENPTFDGNTLVFPDKLLKFEPKLDMVRLGTYKDIELIAFISAQDGAKMTLPKKYDLRSDGIYMPCTAYKRDGKNVMDTLPYRTELQLAFDIKLAEYFLSKSEFFTQSFYVGAEYDRYVAKAYDITNLVYGAHSPSTDYMPILLGGNEDGVSIENGKGAILLGRSNVSEGNKDKFQIVTIENGELVRTTYDNASDLPWLTLSVS